MTGMSCTGEQLHRDTISSAMPSPRIKGTTDDTPESTPRGTDWPREMLASVNGWRQATPPSGQTVAYHCPKPRSGLNFSTVFHWLTHLHAKLFKYMNNCIIWRAKGKAYTKMKHIQRATQDPCSDVSATSGHPSLSTFSVCICHRKAHTYAKSRSELSLEFYKYPRSAWLWAKSVHFALLCCCCRLPGLLHVGFEAGTAV